MRVRALSAVAIACVLLAAPLASGASPRSLRIVYTAETRGNLLPCACPGSPLGGLARRVGTIDSLRAASTVPLIIVDAGRFFPDPPDFPGISDRDLRALRDLHAEAAIEAGYDAIVLDAGAPTPDHGGCWMPSGSAKTVSRGGLRIALLAIDERSDPEEASARLNAAEEVDLLVLLCSGDLNFAQAAARETGARVVVVSRGARFANPLVIGDVLYLGPGHDGKYVGIADVPLTEPNHLVESSVRLRPMDGTAPSLAGWRERVEETVLAIERAHPSAFTQGE